MKEISLPETIVGLPHPWCITSATQRRQKIEILKYSSDEVKTVLNVLEQCLQALSELTLPPGDSIPESLRECWDFSAEWLAEKMPTVDDFDLIKVKEVLKEEGIESPSELMIEEVAESWLWSVGQDIANTALRWLEDGFRKAKDAVLISRFIEIVSRYWKEIDPHLAQSLLSRSAMIGWQEALPLLESVECNTSVASSIRQTAQDYRELILGSSNKN
jgi:hypothetical protein